MKNDPNALPHAEAHGLKVAEMLRACERKLLCLVCGAPISTPDAEVVEVDEEHQPHQAGMVHAGCVRPSFRILGQPMGPLFEEHPLLVNFDVQLWVERIRRGQGLLSSVTGNVPMAHIAWDPEFREEQFGYCVRFALEGGGYFYATKRMRVQRFRKADGEAALAEILRWMGEAAERGNPVCYAESGEFGTLSVLAKLAPGVDYARVVSAELVPFTAEIGKLNDSCDNFYAPLCVLRSRVEEEEIAAHNAVLLLSNPLALGRFTKNWRDAGLNIGEFRVDILADDAAFDAFVRELTRQGRIAVIDPLFDLKQNPISGHPIMVMPER
jgi:hypothetical protein